MADDLFDLDESLSKDNSKYSQELTKGRVFCIRGLYDKALEIYNKILDEDIENEGAYVGLLRVHSKDFTVLNGDVIEHDIHVIESLFPNCQNPDYLSFINKRIAKKEAEENARKEAEEEAKRLAEEKKRQLAEAAEKRKIEAEKKRIADEKARQRELERMKKTESERKKKEAQKLREEKLKEEERNKLNPWLEDLEDAFSYIERYYDKQYLRAAEGCFLRYRKGLVDKKFSPEDMKKYVKKPCTLDYIDYYLGDAYYKDMDFNNALKYFNSSLDISPNSNPYIPELLFHLGRTYGRLDRHKERIECYEKCLLDPRTKKDKKLNGDVLYCMGLSYKYGKGVKKNMDVARDYFEQSSRLGNEYATKLISSEFKLYFDDWVLRHKNEI